MKKYRGKEYLIDFIEMLGEKEVDSAQLINIIKDVDKLHDQISKDYASLTSSYIEKLKKIGDDAFSVSKNENDHRFIIVKITSKETLLEKVEEYYKSCKRKSVAVTKENRDLIVHAAKEIEKDKEISRQKAIRIAKKKITEVDKEKYIKILNLALSKTDGFVEASEIQSVISNKTSIGYGYIKNMAERINLFYEPKLIVSRSASLCDGRSWAVKFDISCLRLIISALNGNSIVKKLSVPKPISKVDKTLQDRIMIFLVAGLLKLRQGRYLDIDEICKVLRNNSYYNYPSISHNDIMNLVFEFPNYFEKTLNKRGILLKGGAFEEIRKRYSPVETEWNIVMCVNSGLSIATIQKFFEKSYVERPDAEGSKIFIVKANRSIESLYKLALIFEIMQSSDYFVGLSYFEKERIEEEYQKIRAITLPYLRSSSIEFDPKRKNDAILLEIEEF